MQNDMFRKWHLRSITEKCLHLISCEKIPKLQLLFDTKSQTAYLGKLYLHLRQTLNQNIAITFGSLGNSKKDTL